MGGVESRRVQFCPGQPEETGSKLPQLAGDGGACCAGFPRLGEAAVPSRLLRIEQGETEPIWDRSSRDARSQQLGSSTGAGHRSLGSSS
jgi:hypothetical protein